MTATEPFAQIGAQLCRATLPFDAALAETMAVQVLAWMHRAAGTLPAEWRDNYLNRAPAVQTLAYRPVLTGPA